MIAPEQPFRLGLTGSHGPSGAGLSSRVGWEEMRVAPKRSQQAQSRTLSCATTTPRVRRAIQASDEKNIVLAKRYGVNRKTIAKWKARESTSDERMGPKNRGSSLLTRDDEAIILAYRWRTRLRLNDCHDRLRRLMPKLSRSTLHRCLTRHGFSRIGSTAPSPSSTSAALRGPYIFEITANEVAFPDDAHTAVRTVFLAVEEVTKHAYAEVVEATPKYAAAFLGRLLAQFPQKITLVTTDIRPMFTDWPGMFGEDMALVSPHPFAVACRANRIAHTRTIPPFTKPSMPKTRTPAVEIR